MELRYGQLTVGDQDFAVGIKDPRGAFPDGDFHSSPDLFVHRTGKVVLWTRVTQRKWKTRV